LKLLINRESVETLLRHLLWMPVGLSWVAETVRACSVMLHLLLALRPIEQKVEEEVEQIDMLAILRRMNLRIAGQLVIGADAYVQRLILS
jgi:hypothetical protein